MSQSHALVSPHPADAVGEVLDRRYVLLEVTEGPGAGFYYAAYDMQELTRKRLRLLPDDAGKPSLDWYMVDDFPRQATKVQATKVQAKVQAALQRLG